MSLASTAIIPEDMIMKTQKRIASIPVLMDMTIYYLFRYSCVRLNFYPVIAIIGSSERVLGTYVPRGASLPVGLFSFTHSFC